MINKNHDYQINNKGELKTQSAKLEQQLEQKKASKSKQKQNKQANNQFSWFRHKHFMKLLSGAWYKYC